MANSRVQSARNDALSAERIRQTTLDRESDALNATSQNRYQDFKGQEETRGEALGKYFTGQDVPEPAPDAALPTSSSNIVVAEEAKQRGQAKDFTDRTGNALGTLRAFGDVLGTNSRLQARDAGLIGQIGGFKKGSSAVVPFELDRASQAGDSMKLFGDILGGFGSTALGAGLSGGGVGGLFGKGASGAGMSATVATPFNGQVPRLGMLY